MLRRLAVHFREDYSDRERSADIIASTTSVSSSRSRLVLRVKNDKVRADQLLVSRGLAESRTRAQALIMAGAVFCGERKLAKAGEMLAEDAPLEVRGKDHPWVSRGGIKLDHGLTHFGFDVAGAVALDVGSSTGGFTDVLLSARGGEGLCGRRRHQPAGVEAAAGPARRRARADQRAHLDAAIIPEPVDIVVCDASFIGLAKVLEAPLKLAKPGAKLVALVKPQFEAGREEVGKGGVVRDPAVHERVCDEAADWVESQGWTVLGHRAEPDHRARRQCRIPAGSREEWLKPCSTGAGGRSRSSRVVAIEVLGGLSGWLSNSGYGNALVRRASTSRASCRPAGLFGVVWPILYALLGIALAMILAEPPSPRRTDRADPVLRPAGAQFRLVADLLRRPRHRPREDRDLRHGRAVAAAGGRAILSAAQARPGC